MEVYLTNHLPSTDIHSVKLSESSIEASGLKIIPFSEVSVLPAGASFQTHMNIAFTSASQTVKLEVVTDRGTYSVSVKPQLGELLRPITLSEADFDSRQKELGGMQESSEHLTLPQELASGGTKLVNKVLELINVGPCVVDVKEGTYKFVGVAIFDEKPLLISLRAEGEGGSCLLRVNCEDPIFAVTAKNLLKTGLAQ
ncbi:AP3 complex beta3B subunit [Acanthamoeba castellanii str. Neff]|uniref:AP3 complex beta3B subunit n=1 Tax=Acanthamoeba castellanii (strain ATCC 30010 / Neff) TaxID=1257118 RepID=L8H2Y1_ACACF|nr:AP3 complex beta3B subunit [Acanthamoeba castellanii str. Neff]ELR19068.1 AP3 complex beta3B subunit [Acanthamoeba castellanii str. Neff]